MAVLGVGSWALAANAGLDGFSGEQAGGGDQLGVEGGRLGLDVVGL
jgi:hypothetical protein